MHCRCRAGSATIAVAKSEAEGGGSKQCLKLDYAAASWAPQRGKNEPSETPLVPLGPALVGNPVCLGQEGHTMHETEVKSEIPATTKRFLTTANASELKNSTC